MIAFLIAWTAMAVDMVFLAPLRLVYFQGPQYKGVGFWEGAHSADICAHVSNGVPASHWDTEAGKSACAELVERKFVAFAIGVYGTIAFLVVWKLMEFLWIRATVVDPLWRAIGLLQDGRQAN